MSFCLFHFKFVKKQISYVMGQPNNFYTNYLHQKEQTRTNMFGKFAQIKNFISHAVTSLVSQRPKPPSDPMLDKKLKFLLDYILRNPVQQQFKAYHSLQSPQMTLNELLRQIYYSDTADTSQIASIVHFFTFLLINCNNQLVLCKIVSDNFVIELTEVYLNSVSRAVQNLNVEVQQINSYKIALIKAYVSRMNNETIKYMIVSDHMKIFENCVSLYEQYLEVEEQEQFGVESTCISNSILLIVRFLSNPDHSITICNQQSGKGLVYLLIKMVQHIHKLMLAILNSNQEKLFQFQLLKDKIMLLIDIFHSISEQQIKTKVIAQTSKELTDLRDFFKQIALQHTAILNQDNHNYIKNLQLIKVLLKLLAIYHDSQALIPVFQQCLLPLLNKFVKLFKNSCKQIFNQSTHVIESNEVTERQLADLLAAKVKLSCIFCCNMEILASVVKGGQYLSRRNIKHQSEKEFKTVITNILIDLMEQILSEQGEPLQELLCFKSIKFMLLSVMQLTIQNEHTLHEYSVIKFHQFAINKLKRHLKKSDLWDYVVLHYESILTMISHNLLIIEENEPYEYAFCQFHDPNKHRQPHHLDALINAIYINECSRDFRFMIVQKTKVSLQDIKLEKNYHSNFISKGWNLEPGTELKDQINVVCELTHFSKGLKIPILVIEDEECLLFASKNQQIIKIILNIRYKSIQGFFVEKDVVHIKLKGLQQILVEAGSKDQKQDLKNFRQYLSSKRDKSRERQLKFIHHYLDIYLKDNTIVMNEMGQEDIEPQSPIKQQIKQEEKEAEVEAAEEQTKEEGQVQSGTVGSGEVVDDV